MFKIIKVWLIGFLLFKGLSFILPQIVVGDLFGFGFFLLILALINYIVKPVLQAIGAPLSIVTLGLFSTVINFFCLWIALALSSVIQINATGLLWFFYLLLISSILSWLGQWE
jgi:putative membrane protein